MAIAEFLTKNSRQRYIDAALLFLRVWTSLSLFVKHGLDKLLDFSHMAALLSNAVHVGARPVLAFGLVSDCICSILVLLGLGTRPACIVILTSLFGALAVVHHFHYMHDPFAELIILYMGAYVTVLLAGPGRFSLESLIARRRRP
jgi:putative oxidoreductase